MNDFITIRDIYDYFACPYRVHLRRFIGLGQSRIENIFNYGKEIEERSFSLLSKKYKILWKNLYIECERLKLKGIVDGVIKQGREYIVFDIKAGDKLHNWYKMQLVGEALLVECSKNIIIKRGFIFN